MTATLSPLTGRTAFISGAGHGIGRATALALAARGAVVGINDLKPEFVEDAVAAVRAAGGQAIGLPCDVSTRDGMREAVQRFASDAGRLDVMVNNAAWVRYQTVAEITPEVMDRMVEIGFKSVIWGIQAAAEAMDAERGGAIINVASVAAFKSPMRSVVYSGIKAGVLGITRAAAADLGARRIRVNAVAPGAVPTEGTVRNRNAELDARRIARTPLGRLGTVQDIADAIVFLASDEARFLNAEVLRLDGGASETSL
ncbi:SDR family NAD(P)-dependent oxidoreductase [Pseudacidovorax sp. RU35E]|uniref:SDR family NAD(P)-dependent oxidoreductase n=1 Tax=Pseudacidovorax sp. RU35E TaxID=1907403 RepID=UPI000954F463|nr:glucose 1-dehydrogenase [Pseudacidovorax sp. RU35E]SIQ91616.1 3-oxoacyl-[acyl-carrier protein] reductase [Pseudacidovorax sp. RU35E]